MLTAILWFRDDLRLADNPALQAALKSDYAIIPIYIHAPDEEGRWAPGEASNAWRHRSLQALDSQLRTRGSRLRIFFGPTLQTLQTLIASTGADAVFWNRRYEPAMEQRDATIKAALRKEGLRAESFNAALLYEPWELQTGQGDPYKVFTPFWKTALSQWREPKLEHAPESITAIKQGPEGVSLDTLKLAPALDWDAGFWERFTPGESGAHAALNTFINDALTDYRESRDMPAFTARHDFLRTFISAKSRPAASLPNCKTPAMRTTPPKWMATSANWVGANFRITCCITSRIRRTKTSILVSRISSGRKRHPGNWMRGNAA